MPKAPSKHRHRKSFKSTGTQTATKSKRKSPDGGSGSSGDMNKVIYKAKKMSKGKLKARKRFATKVAKALEAEQPKQTILQNRSERLVWNTGQQGIMQIYERDVDTLRGLLQQATQTSSTADDFAEKYRLLNHHRTGYYTNNSKVGGVVMIDWYTVVPRVQNINSPLADWTQACGTPAAGGEGTTVGGVNAATVSTSLPGLTPFQFSGFCTKWKITSIRRIIIQPGETKEFRYSFGSRIVEGSKFQQGATQYTAIPGLTVFHMLVCRGQPCHDSVSGNVSITEGSLDLVMEDVYQVKATPSPVGTNSSAQSITSVLDVYPSIQNNAEMSTEFTPNLHVIPDNQ